MFDPFSGYIKMPRSLECNDKWIKCKLAYKRLFTIILQRCTFSKTKQDRLGEDIYLERFQLFVTIRQLQEWCGEGVSKNDVERGLKYFVLVGFLRQEVRRGKTLITVCNLEFCNENRDNSETVFETGLRQKRDIKEESKESKDVVVGKIVPFDERPTDSLNLQRFKSSVFFNWQTQTFEGITQEFRDALCRAYPMAFEGDSSLLEGHLKGMTQWIFNKVKTGKMAQGKYLGIEFMQKSWFPQANVQESKNFMNMKVAQTSPAELTEEEREILRNKRKKYKMDDKKITEGI